MTKNITLIAILLVTTMLSSFAQSPMKIGYTNAELILMTLPETKQVEADLKEYQTQVGKEMQAKRTEFETKMAYLQKEGPNLVQLVVQQKQEELQRLSQEIQKFEQQASRDFEQKQQKLLAPLYQKVQKGIDEVAKENGYTYIISTNAGGAPVLIFASDDAQKNHDITEKVVAKLGGTMPKEEGGE